MLFKIGTLCNDASLVREDLPPHQFSDSKNSVKNIKKGSQEEKIGVGAWKILGDPTEGAIIVAGKKFEALLNRNNYKHNDGGKAESAEAESYKQDLINAGASISAKADNPSISMFELGEHKINENPFSS